MSRSVTFTINAGVATITLSQPEVRNAFSDEVIADITAAFHAAGQHTQVRVVVLAAEGPAFCAGANLHWMQSMATNSHAHNIAAANQLATMLHTIYTCPHPTIARVQGDASAGGIGLVAACDMAVAANTAQFCLSETKIGLVPATIAPYVLRAMGARAAHRYFLTAERFDATEALRIGLLHQVVPAEDLDHTVDQLLKHLLQAGPQALRSCKKLLLETAEHAITPAFTQRTVQLMADVSANAEGQEGVQAFLDKRKPTWLS